MFLSPEPKPAVASMYPCGTYSYGLAFERSDITGASARPHHVLEWMSPGALSPTATSLSAVIASGGHAL